MKLEGTHTIAAPPDRVYRALTDPVILARCMPGCEKLSLTDERTYELAINAGVGAIKGSYIGTIVLADLQPPYNYRMRVDVKGKTGFVKGDSAVNLADAPEGTAVTYSADIQVGGPVASVGQRMLLSTARMMTRQLFGAIDAEAVALPGEVVKHGIFRDLLRAFVNYLRTLFRSRGQKKEPKE